MPWYIALIYFLWLASCLGSIIKLRKKKIKWSECILPSVVFTVIFTFVFCASIDTGHYFFDGDTFMWIFAPFLNLPIIYYLGSYLYKKIVSYENTRKKILIGDLQRQITQYENEIRELNNAIYSKKRIMVFINLLGYCDATNIKDLKCDKRINDCFLISNSIDEKQKLIEQLNSNILEIRNK